MKRCPQPVPVDTRRLSTGLAAPHDKNLTLQVCIPAKYSSRSINVRTALKGIATSLSSAGTRRVARHDDGTLDLHQCQEKFTESFQVAWTPAEDVAIVAAAGGEVASIYSFLFLGPHDSYPLTHSSQHAASCPHRGRFAVARDAQGNDLGPATARNPRMSSLITFPMPGRDRARMEGGDASHETVGDQRCSCRRALLLSHPQPGPRQISVQSHDMALGEDGGMTTIRVRRDTR